MGLAWGSVYFPDPRKLKFHSGSSLSGPFMPEPGAEIFAFFKKKMPMAPLLQETHSALALCGAELR